MVKLIDRQVSNLPVISWARGKPTVIVAHETANPNSSVEGEIKYMSNNYRNAFYHYIAGEDGFYMLHNPDIGGAWGAGPSMHNYAIHVELIRSSTKAGFNKAYNNYVEGIKYLADKYDIPLKVDKGTDKRGIYTHNYVTKTFGGTTHTDPVAYFKQYGKTINQFAKDLGASSGSVSKPSKPSKSANTATSVVDYLNAKGQDSSFSNRKKLASKHGIKNYKGTASQNTKLLNKLKGGSPASKPSKSVKQMASEVKKGLHGNGHANRRKSLGVSNAKYQEVRNYINKGGSTSTKKPVSQMAQEIIDGKHGSGHANRRKSLGISNAEYQKVRSLVNKRM